MLLFLDLRAGVQAEEVGPAHTFPRSMTVWFRFGIAATSPS